MTARFTYTPEIREKMRLAKLRNPTRYWLGKTFSEEYRKKLSEAHKGQIPWHVGTGRFPHWKGGITKGNRVIRNSQEYKEWRLAVFKRDNFMCIWGGVEHGRNIQADHIKPFAKFPELRFDINNGRTLCKGCHKKHHARK